jgi:hypothetical protein
MDRHALFFLLVCCALTLVAASVQAQRPVVIKGRVTDTSGRPVAAALIGVAAFNASTTSDTHGTYRLVIGSRVRAGQHAVLTASREGFDYARRAVILAPGAELTESFRLRPLE